MDTKKTELIGQFKNGGRQWAPAGTPVEVNTHDFPSQAEGKAIPYGIYDLANDEGWVSVGIDHDTEPVRRRLDPGLAGEPRTAAVPQRDDTDGHR